MEKIFNVRECGFKPEEYLKKIRYSNGQEALVLFANVRRAWMQQYCNEKGINVTGVHTRLVSVENASACPDLFLAEAEIHWDGVCVASAQASVAKNDPLFGVPETAQTRALSRALAYLCFDSPVIAEAESAALAEEFAPKSGQVTFQPINLNEESPAPEADTDLPFTIGEVAPAPAEQPVQKKRGRPPKAKPEEAPQPTPIGVAKSAETFSTEQPVVEPTTLEEAMRFILPRGKYAGEMFGIVNGKNEGYARWLARDDFKAEDDIAKAMKAAAKIIVESKKQFV